MKVRKKIQVRALTLHQPWASLVAMGLKSWETRSWQTKYRGLIVITASKTVTLEGHELFHKLRLNGIMDEFPPQGVAVCLVKLSGIVPTEDVETNPHVYLQTDREWFWERAFGDYTPGRYAWKLTELHKLREPIPVSGNRMLWKPGRITLDWINKQEGMKL